MIAQLVVAAGLAAASTATAPADDRPPLRRDVARILAAGPRPAGSGMFAVYADFDVMPAGSAVAERMYKLWLGAPDEFLPEAGMLCTISYRREPLLGGNAHRDKGQEARPDNGPHDVVESLDCAAPWHAEALRARAEDLLLPRAPVVLDRAYVIAAAPRANVLTSMIEVTTDFEVIAGGERYTLTMHDDPYEYFPPAGAVCRITYYPAAIVQAPNYRGPNRVAEAECDSGRFPDLHPGLIERGRITDVAALPVRHGRQPHYVQLEVARIGRAAPTLYLRRGDDAPPAPALGAECSIAFTYRTLQGRDLGLPPRDSHWLPVVDRLDCGPAPAGP